jgi:hypothetical protein
MIAAAAAGGQTAGLSVSPVAQGAAETGHHASAAAQPLFAVRELYAPGHFGNSYEVMGENQMRGMLAEAAWWGFNRYGDWFDTQDCSDPFAEKKWVQLAHALWDRKKANFRSAQALGLACDLLITPNHVYVDQCSPHLLAVKKGRIFGQLICPSKPEARAIILRNYENLLGDLARAGVRLKAISACPCDFGAYGRPRGLRLARRRLLRARRCKRGARVAGRGGSPGPFLARHRGRAGPFRRRRRKVPLPRPGRRKGIVVGRYQRRHAAAGGGLAHPIVASGGRRAGPLRLRQRAAVLPRGRRPRGQLAGRRSCHHRNRISNSVN